MTDRNVRRPATLKRRDCLTWAAAAALPSLAFSQTPGLPDATLSALDRIRARGSLIVGLYQDLPPFHVKGVGIDVDLGLALAAKLGVKYSPLAFMAGEEMDDDLRNMVTKGHYLGWGPADVLLHVPVDAPLMQANPKVEIFAPYYRERVMLAWDTQRLPRVDALSDLVGKPVAVAGQSLAGWLLIGAEGGSLRPSLRTALKDGVEAAQALKSGEVVAVAGNTSELESVLGEQPRYAITQLPAPRSPRDGWAIGCAVKHESKDLAFAVQQAIQDLQASGELRRMFASHGVHWRL